MHENELRLRGSVKLRPTIERERAFTLLPSGRLLQLDVTAPLLSAASASETSTVPQ